MLGKDPSTTSGGSHRRILLCVIVAAVAAVAVAAVLFMRQADTSAPSVPEETEPQKVSITINVSGEGFDPSASTPVPLHIEGGDVSEDVFSDGSGNAEAEFAAGDYTVTVAAPCISSDGSLFKDSDSVPASLVINDGDDSVGILVAVAAADPINVTDDEIQQAKDYAAKAGVDSGTVDEYAQKATQKRQDALDAKAAEEEAARQAAEQQKAEQQAVAEKQQALAANPSVIHSVPNSQDSETVTLTGTLCMETRPYPVHPGQQEDVYYLELPSQVTVTGTQYGDRSDTKAIVHKLQSSSGTDVPDPSYVGKTISVTGQVAVNVTESDPSYDISKLNFFDVARLTKVFS